MPSVDINSNNIITFEFSDAINIYQRTMLFTDLSTYGGSNGSGKDNVIGISFQVKDKNGVVYTDFDFDTPDIVPADSSTWTFDWSAFGLPFLLGNTLIITGGIKDQDGTIYYTVPVYKKICKPNGLTESGYVPGIFQVIPNCIDNVLTVKELSVLIYDKKTPSSVSKSGNLYYPTGTDVTVAFTGTPFSNNLIVTGQSRVECTTVATYDLGDEIYVLVTYLTKQQFNITCSNFLGDIACCLSKNQQTYLQNCGNAIGASAQQKSYEILPSLVLGLLKQISGEDASVEVAFIKKTLACDCGVNSLGQNEMTPLNPAVTNIVLVGAGGTSIGDPEINGDTKTFTILSKNYLVSKSDSLDLSYSITTDTSVENQVNFKLKFNTDIEAGYILTAIGNNSMLLSQLNSLITFANFNIDLSNLNGKCVIDISSINYFLSYKVPDGSALLKSILINGTTYTAPDGLTVSNTDGIVGWLNGLSLGTFESSFSNAVTGAYINILTNSNSNTVTSAVFTISGSDTTVLFQKTSKSLIAVLQAIIDYLCSLTALQVSLGNSLTLQYFDYNGDITSVNYTATQSQNDYNVGLQNVINNIVQRINDLTALTCSKIAAIFVDRPLSQFVGAGRLFGIDQDGNCTSFTQQQVGLSVMQSVNSYQNVKDVFCAIDCGSPASCPDVSNINLAMSGSNIGIYGLTWANTPTAVQTVTVRYQVNGTTSWITSTNALQILPNGNISGSVPYVISGVSAGTTYNVQIFNNCGGAGFIKQITTPTGTVYSGSYLLDTVIYNICGDSPVTLYSSTPFAPSTIMYSDAGLTTLVTGYNYIADNTGTIYTIDSSTAVVGASTGTACDTGTANGCRLANDTTSICSASSVTLYTNGAFTIGGTLYNDSALTSPVTGYSYVLLSDNNHIYNLNSSTGAIGSDTSLTCSAVADTCALSNVLMTICGEGSETLYSTTGVEVGATMYYDPGLTSPVNDKLYLLYSATGIIYNINGSGVITSTTGDAC